MSKITIRNHNEITRILKRASQWVPQIGIHYFGCPDFCVVFLLFFVPSVVHDDDFFGGIMLQNWLVVSTHLKNISQNGNLLQIRVKIKNIWNHRPENEWISSPKRAGFVFFFKGDSRNDIMVNLEVLKGFNPPCLFRLGRLRVKAAVFRHHPKGFTGFPWDFISCKCFKNPWRSWRCLGSHRIILPHLRIPQFTSSAFKE